MALNSTTVTRKVSSRTRIDDWKTLSPFSKRIMSALTFLLLLPAISIVAAPPPPNIHFSQPSVSPAMPGPNDQVTVNVTVTANAGIQNVTLHYTTDGWKTTNTTVVASYNSTSQIALAHIPAQYNGGRVEYYFVAFDNNDNMRISDNGGNYFTYTVAAPTSSSTTSLWIEIAIVLTAVGAAVAIGIYSLKPKPASHKPI